MWGGGGLDCSLAGVTRLSTPFEAPCPPVWLGSDYWQMKIEGLSARRLCKVAGRGASIETCLREGKSAKPVGAWRYPNSTVGPVQDVVDTKSGWPHQIPIRCSGLGDFFPCAIASDRASARSRAIEDDLSASRILTC